jgi:hypothetical protein
MYIIKNVTKLNPHIRGAQSVFINIGGQTLKIRSGKEIAISDGEYKENKKMITSNGVPDKWSEDIKFMVVKKDLDITTPLKKKETAPVKEAPVKEAPAEEAPVEEAPVEEAPVEEAPVEEAPVEEAPVEEAPVEEPKLEYDKKTLLEKTHGELDAIIEDKGLVLEFSRQNPNKEEKVTKILAALQ